MKTTLIYVFSAILLILNIQGIAQVKYSINESWKFLKDSSIIGVEQFNSELGRAVSVDLPHTWNDKDVVDEVEGYYRGAGWYSKELKISKTLEGKQLFLFFEGVNQEAEVYVNSRLAGKHVGGYTRFVVPISEYIEFGPDQDFAYVNLVVKADNAHNEDIPTLSADFTFFGGIYRDVSLIAKEKVHFAFEKYASTGIFITTPKVSEETGEVHIKAKVKNDGAITKKIKIVTTLYDPHGVVVISDEQALKVAAGEQKVHEFDLAKVQSPKLWSPDSPNLYRVVSQLIDSKTKQVVDETVNPLGFRWYKFDAETGFFLNGKQLKLIGTNRHQDYKGIGNALPDYIHYEDIVKMKKMGSNFLRIAHYPQDPAILETCDRLGILTTVEIPIVNTITESEAFSKNCLSAHLEMIRQNYNHPSLIIWAYMNEIILHPKFKKDKERYDIYTANIVKLAQQIENLTRKEDPYRYTMIPNHNRWEHYKEPGLTDVPMIVAWNIYNGWYGGEYDILAERLELLHKEIKKPMIIAEYGAGADPRLHTLNPIRFDFTQEYATNYHNHYLTLFKKLPYVAGVNVWNYADFNSESRVDAVQSINNKGLVGLDRKPKDVFYFYQASLLKEPFIGIATKTWGRRSALENKQGTGVSTMPVQVFSNQKEIELYINGKSLGKKNTSGAITVFDVPFVNGENRLRAVSEGFEDYSIVKIDMLPITLDKFPTSGISINLGDQRFFYDDRIDQAWYYDKKYSEGSWGHIGGVPYKRSVKRPQQPYGTKKTIDGTFNDPIYQTQLQGIEQFRFDVKAGTYEINLLFAELEGKKAKKLVYDLTGSEPAKTKIVDRVFSVRVNGTLLIDKMDLMQDYGACRAVKIKHEVQVNQDGPIIIKFDKIKGEPVLNGIELYKKL